MSGGGTTAIPDTVALFGAARDFGCRGVLVERLLRAFPKTIKGIKASSGEFAGTLAFVDHFAKDWFEVYCGDDAALHGLRKAGGARCISGASNVTSAINAQICRQVGTPGADEAQVLLTALRKFIAGVPLIPGLKALVARQTSEAAWTNMRPPNVALSADSAKLLFAAFDKSSRAPAHTA